MLKRILTQIDELGSYFDHLDAKKETISQRDVRWQLDHSLIVLIGILEALSKSDPKDCKLSFNRSRFMVFNVLGYIPRGQGKAPKVVQPNHKASLEELKAKAETARNWLKQAADWPAQANFKHPFFGLLDKKLTLKFLKIHTEHHLKIVRDILK